VDTSVVHPAAPTYLKLRPGAATKKRESEKRSQYLHAAELQGAKFYPVVVESFGAFGEGAVLFLAKLSEEIVAGGIKSYDEQNIRLTLIDYQLRSDERECQGTS